VKDWQSIPFPKEKVLDVESNVIGHTLSELTSLWKAFNQADVKELLGAVMRRFDDYLFIYDLFLFIADS
jgi:hypothetical protein